MYEVRCKNGKCDYDEKEFEIGDCTDCNIVEQIEHDLMSKQLGKRAKK